MTPSFGTVLWSVLVFRTEEERTGVKIKEVGRDGGVNYVD